MAQIFDPETGFPVADPESPLFPKEYSFTATSLDLSSFILSASGWRKVFAADGNEESCTFAVSIADKERLILISHVLSEFFRKKNQDHTPCIAVGIDTRYTGPAIADVLIRGFLAHGLKVRYVFISAAPEIMAYTKKSTDLDGFAYISASHNPVGHNGLKFGLSNGAVLGGTDSSDLIAALKKAAETAEGVRETIDLIRKMSATEIRSTYEAAPRNKREAVSAYSAFSKEVIVGTGVRIEETAGDLKKLMERNPVGVVADMNGSARTVSIDGAILKEFGVLFKSVNDIPRQIAHRIVPEGESLRTCADFLEAEHGKDGRFLFGYMPDNDGDRGNLVYSDDDGRSRILEAQEVFALVCIAELSWLAFTGAIHYNAENKAEERIAIVVNDPTSLRIERIAAAFDARVFRAEVGEANVVNLAADLRKSGYIVRVLGEGSNGGNITHPSTVRDPIDTVFSILKLLSVRTERGRPGLFDIWCGRNNRTFGENFSLSDIIATIPRFVTTSAFEDRAKMTIGTKDHARLKARYESVFRREWDLKKTVLREKFGIFFYEEIIYEGSTETRGEDLVSKGIGIKGGFKILFKDFNGKPVGFIWMRGSGTEPVFRVMADIAGGNPEDESWLLDWHKKMILEADTSG